MGIIGGQVKERMVSICLRAFKIGLCISLECAHKLLFLFLFNSVCFERVGGAKSLPLPEARELRHPFS